jgi:hypothetical protein
MMQRGTFWFRSAILIFAGILALQAVWLITADFFHPMLAYFPQDKASEERASAARSAAVTAASIGWVRGGLWTEAAIALSSDFISKVAGGSDARLKPQRDQARTVALRAARLSPHDCRTWLLLAALGPRFDRQNWGGADRLKMSYFTGPNEVALAPLRIRIATRSMAINNAELQRLVAQEIRSIVLHHQNLKRSLRTAYREGSPEGKKFIEATIGDLDKDFLATIRAGGK